MIFPERSGGNFITRGPCCGCRYTWIHRCKIVFNVWRKEIMRSCESSSMLKIIRNKVDFEILQEVSQDLKGYIKVVVDVRRNILSAGGEKHVDGEQMLLKDGIKQEDLWEAGLDLETNEMDFDSMINIRPTQNASREILDPNIRQQVGSITRSLLEI